MLRQKLFLYFTGVFILLIIGTFFFTSSNIRSIFSQYEKGRLKDALSEIKQQYLDIKFQSENLLLSLVSRHSVIKILQKYSKQTFYTLKENARRELISELIDIKTHRGVSLLRVYDTKSMLVLDLFNLNRKSGLISKKSIIRNAIDKKEKAEFVTKNSKEYIYTFTSPIYSSNGSWLGSMSLGFSISQILQQVRELTGFHLFFVEDDNGVKKLFFSTMRFMSEEVRKKFEQEITVQSDISKYSISERDFSFGTSINIKGKEKGKSFIIIGSMENLKIRYLLEELNRDFLIIFLVAVLLAIMLTFYISSIVTSPLKELIKVYRKFGEGEYDSRIELKTGDEFQELGDTLNNMAEKIMNSDSELRNFNSELQKEVGQISSELGVLHKELKQTEKLSALGVLAAGIVHEIKTPLTTLKGTTSYLKNKSKEGEVQFKYLSTMVDEIERIQGITHNIMNFVRKDRDFRKISEILEPIQTILNPAMVKERIFLNMEIKDNLKFSLPADSMKQILINLMMNSKEAIKEKPGHISVTVAIVDDKTGPSCTTGCIIIRDDGEGVATEYKEKIFEPFFSINKKDGTGLGLSIVKKMINEADGQIILIDDEEKGAAFKITLPFVK
ncbi:HAMP domain-containing protein [bacterium]|nr:HAMP domain-containing protein [bacterium]